MPPSRSSAATAWTSSARRIRPGSKRSRRPDVDAARALPAGNIVLVGFMASGKSAVGRALAERTGRKLVDTDDVVMNGGTTIDDLFASEGEAGFRRRERKVVQGLARVKDSVIS